LQLRAYGKRQIAAARQTLAPHAPKRVGAAHFVFVFTDTLLSFESDARVQLSRGSVTTRLLRDFITEHIQIVDLAEQILHMLQILAPPPVVIGEKILDGVAKAFDPDAQLMKIAIVVRAHGEFVEAMGIRPTLQRQMSIHKTSRRESTRPPVEFFREFQPSLGVELLESVARSPLLIVLSC
jgi:hypothetical protein